MSEVLTGVIERVKADVVKSGSKIDRIIRGVSNAFFDDDCLSSMKVFTWRVGENIDDPIYIEELIHEIEEVIKYKLADEKIAVKVCENRVLTKRDNEIAIEVQLFRE